jgi:hypothetical protein
MPRFVLGWAIAAAICTAATAWPACRAQVQAEHVSIAVYVQQESFGLHVHFCSVKL